MGRYINPGNDSFKTARNSEYVDKSGIIEFLNASLDTTQKLMCVSRPRRFGKSMTAGMLCAYYSKGCDSRTLFDDLEIAKSPSFEQCLNKYPLLYLDVTNFTTDLYDIESSVERMQHTLIKDLQRVYPQVVINPDDTLMDALYAVVEITHEKFIVIIDEWDAICREAPKHPDLMKQYIAMLRRMFKSNETDVVFAGVYMTGILPIKQYGVQSALNNFQPFSMINPGRLAEYYGFTHDEVNKLCTNHNVQYEAFKEWYDGYRLGGIDVFNPNSVMMALHMGICDNYWNKTESFASLRNLIDIDVDGMQNTLEDLLKGESVSVDVLTHYGEDDGSINSRNELLTLLIHYGYLNYDFGNKAVKLPNMEISTEFKSAISEGSRKKLVDEIKSSDALLAATLRMDEEAVCHAFRRLHKSYCDSKHYNNEQALRALIKRAYFSSIDKYIRVEELNSGEGYVDVVFIPRSGGGVPALVVELKYNSSVKTAIDQIRSRDYPLVISEFTDNLLLVGISYDPKSKEHSCRIEALKGGLVE